METRAAGKILGIRLGKILPKVFELNEVENEPSAITKLPVSEAHLTPLGIEGDEQCEPYHGGIHKALLLYSRDSYEALAQRVGLEFDYQARSGFGENLLLEGLSEGEVCVGDRYAVGEAEIEISQPRQPCWKLSANHRSKTLALELYRRGLSGYYARVITAGKITQGDTLTLLARPYPRLTIAALNALIQNASANEALSQEALACEALAPGFKGSLAHCFTHRLTTPPPYTYFPED